MGLTEVVFPLQSSIVSELGDFFQFFLDEMIQHFQQSAEECPALASLLFYFLQPRAPSRFKKVGGLTSGQLSGDSSVDLHWCP